MIPFDREFASIAPEDFCSRILVEQLGARTGLGRRELPLRRPGQGHAGAARLPAGVRDERRAAGRGRRGDRLLDPDPRPGRGRRRRGRGSAASARRSCSRARSSPATRCGRTLGFPTANVVPDERYVYPGHGIYAAFADGKPAAVNVGVRPTFESGRGVLIETYIIDHDEDLYGRQLRIAFVKRLRGEKRFASTEELIAQMHRDVEEAREVCATFSRP